MTKNIEKQKNKENDCKVTSVKKRTIFRKENVINIK